MRYLSARFIPVCLIAMSLLASAQEMQDTLKQGFVNPPANVRPRVWWHWMNGNISEEGLKLDLEWMHRVGVGGVTIFEGAIDTPQVVPHRLVYMTPEWKHAVKYAVETARGLGMEVAIASSAGWSETGGPWVPPSQGIKKLVWSASRIEGGAPFHGVLQHPPMTTGGFQNQADPAHRLLDGTVVQQPEFYGEAAVIAYRIPAADKSQTELAPRITTSKGEANVQAFSDGDVNTTALVLEPAAGQTSSWLLFDYGKEQAIQSVILASPDDMGSVFGYGDDGMQTLIQRSDDGVNFTTVAQVHQSSVIERTTAFEAAAARYWRVAFLPGKSKLVVQKMHITELVLTTGARVNEFEKRSGFAHAANFYTIADPKVKPGTEVKRSDVVDLTARMMADGTLDWTSPPGDWMVLRFGYSLTGHENGPAPAEATGLEVDKLDKSYVTSYMEGYLKMYAETVGTERMGVDGISHLLTDSIEVGPQNWTDKMLDEFKVRRGYDARLWLPAMTGVVLGSTTETDRFLWDVRRTVAELIAENHYGSIATVLHRHGMKYYSEALEYHRPSIGDDMEMRSHADIPMGAMWTWTKGEESAPTYLADLRGAASVAHIYGQNLVGAESMTSNGPAWGWSPRSLKTIADFEFSLGVNLFQIHESSHQPVADMTPGMTLGPYGVWFNRSDTWAEQAGPWVSYLARCSYLLQQGHFAADVAYFYGEEGPLTAVYGWEGPRDLPSGFAFDYVNADAILHRLSVKGGKLITPSGSSYKLIYLGGRSQRITLPVLRQLLTFVKQGAILVGKRPVDSPSLADDPDQVQAVIHQIWGREEARSGGMRRLGKGKVIAGGSINDAMKLLGEEKDFEPTQADPELMFVHRKLAAGEIYFVNNRKPHTEHVNAFFRVSGKTPEVWDAASGEIHSVSYRTEGSRTVVPLDFDPDGTLFVVFRKPTEALQATTVEPHPKSLPALHNALNSGWTVDFNPGRGAPAKIQMEHLASWSEDARAGVKYFSGTATYTKEISAPDELLKPNMRQWLDLGDVAELEEVTVNGKHLGTVWKKPYRIEVTGALQPGSNLITVAVTNLWVNRLIGDQQSWSLRKYTFADFTPYKTDAPLTQSGLLGPVELLAANDQSDR